MPTPFEYLDSINTTKIDIMESIEDEKDYSPYMINKGLSLFKDTCIIANEMNRYPNIPKKWNYDFYINIVTKKKRFSKWHKKDKESDELKMIADYFKCSYNKSKIILSILTSPQVDEIKSITNIGGR